MEIENQLINDPERFGPRLWPIIHMEAKRMDSLLTIRQNDKKLRDNKAYMKHTHILYTFVDNLNTFVPCVNCAKNYLEFKTKQPLPTIDLEKYEKDSFWKWSVDLHNHANEQTNKRIYSYQDAARMFYKEWIRDYTEEEALSFRWKREEDHQKITDMEEQLKNAGLYYHIPEYGYIIIISVLLIIILILVGFKLSQI